MTFRVIPVIDLRGGVVVRARAGERDAYAPIATPLASGSAPADVARGLLNAYPCEVLYVADLDAIVDRTEPDHASLRAIRRACPGLVLWIDAGFDAQAGAARLLAEGLGRPVLGSESQRDAGLLRNLGDRAVLSLDSRGGERLGPASLHDEPALWPDDVIVMTLGRIGGDGGPDRERIEAAVRRRPDVRVYAAGGVRGPEDIAALERIGAAGALVASAIHDGRLRPQTA